MSFADDFNWQRRLIPKVKQALSQHLIAEAPWEEDAKHNTDLIVLELKPIRVACRLRTHDYLRRYADQFTLRSKRPSGVQTELSKVISGWGDYLFYGFANSAGDDLATWFLGDLNEFRRWHSNRLALDKGEMPGREQSNGDRSSKFRAYDLNELPTKFLIHRELPVSAARVA